MKRSMSLADPLVSRCLEAMNTLSIELFSEWEKRRMKSSAAGVVSVRHVRSAFRESSGVLS